MHALREQREYAVLEAAQQEHEAWTELERASRPDRADEALVRAYRERWREVRTWADERYSRRVRRRNAPLGAGITGGAVSRRLR